MSNIDEARDRLRKKAQNENTVFALNDLLDSKNQEIESLRAEVADLKNQLAALQPATSQGEPGLYSLDEVLKFVLGEGSLAGCWFGDKPEGEYNCYWWRNHLRDAMQGRRLDATGIIAILKGIDRTETEAPDGWWETSDGAKFGASILARISALSPALPEDLANQIAYLKWRIDHEESFSHLDMAHNVLPIIRNLEALRLPI